MIKILIRICNSEGWSWVQYHGKMTFDARDKSIAEFNQGDKRVFIASLKAGGLGLNLTAASKVILLDLWWNESVENQAFARVYRIGQVADVSVVRFVVNNTVDNQLQALQEHKTMEIDKAMGDRSRPGRYVMSIKPSATHSIADDDRLSIPELMRLFGPVDKDDQGNEFILVDDEAELDEVSDKDMAEMVPPRPF